MLEWWYVNLTSSIFYSIGVSIEMCGMVMLWWQCFCDILVKNVASMAVLYEL